MSSKPGPKKQISKVKIYADTVGTHKVSADGSHMSIGGSTFKRTVLPSVAKPPSEDMRLNDQIETIDEQTCKEVEE